MNKIVVRLEEPRDYYVVEEVIKAAFSYPERIERSNIGCCLEHYMVHRLREKDGIIIEISIYLNYPEFSKVAFC
jgi:hypothetical protein